MTNTELNQIKDVIELLKTIPNTETHIKNLESIYAAGKEEKKSATARSQKYNEQNVEYHRLINNISRTKRAGQTELYNKWCAKLEEWKKANRPQKQE